MLNYVDKICSLVLHGILVTKMSSLLVPALVPITGRAVFYGSNKIKKFSHYKLHSPYAINRNHSQDDL